MKSGQWSSAITDFNTALRLNPRLASSLYGRGYAKTKNGDVAGGNELALHCDLVVASTAARFGMSLAQIGEQLRRECRAVGLEQADVVIGLSDGGNGLENCLVEAVTGLAREVVFILDFYHASEHLREFGTAEDGRLFSSERGNVIAAVSAGRKKLPVTPDSPATTMRCARVSTPASAASAMLP